MRDQDLALGQVPQAADVTVDESGYQVMLCVCVEPAPAEELGEVVVTRRGAPLLPRLRTTALIMCSCHAAVFRKQGVISGLRLTRAGFLPVLPLLHVVCGRLGLRAGTAQMLTAAHLSVQLSQLLPGVLLRGDDLSGEHLARPCSTRLGRARCGTDSTVSATVPYPGDVETVDDFGGPDPRGAGDGTPLEHIPAVLLPGQRLAVVGPGEQLPVLLGDEPRGERVVQAECPLVGDLEVFVLTGDDARARVVGPLERVPVAPLADQREEQLSAQPRGAVRQDVDPAGGLGPGEV